MEARIEAILVDSEGNPVTLAAFIADIELTDRYVIQDARTAFNALSEAERELVSNKADLFALEAAVKPLVDNELAFLMDINSSIHYLMQMMLEHLIEFKLKLQLMLITH